MDIVPKLYDCKIFAVIYMPFYQPKRDFLSNYPLYIMDM